MAYSRGPYTDFLVLSDTSLDITVNFYHELVHVVLGDFGRTPLKGRDFDPGVNTKTKEAEKEATDNAAEQ